MDNSDNTKLALAEEACPLIARLTAMLCKRPVPRLKADHADLDGIIRDLDSLLEENLSAIEADAFELVRAEADDIGDILDDLEESALGLLEMAARIWEASFAPQAESLRPLLAALAERPVVDLILHLQALVQIGLAPWQKDDEAGLPAELEINLTPLFKDIAAWQKERPGVLKAEIVIPG